MYGKLINGKLEYAPKNYFSENGVIVNFNLDKNLMEQYGFKKIKNNYPKISEGYIYVFDKYTEDDNNIIINYRVEKEINTPTMEEKLNVIESKMTKIEQLQNEIQNILMQERNEGGYHNE